MFLDKSLHSTSSLTSQVGGGGGLAGGWRAVGGRLARVITFSIACNLCTNLFLCKCH